MSEFFDAAAAITRAQSVAVQQGRIQLILQIHRWGQRHVNEISPAAWTELMRIIGTEPPEVGP